MAHRSPFRILRSVAMGGSVLGLGISAHVAAGGSLAAPLIMIALAAVTMATATVLTVRRLNVAVLLATLLGSQWLIHTVLEAASTSGTASAGAINTAGQAMHGMTMDLHGAMPLPSTSMHSMADHPWMTVAHVAAAVVSALMMAKGEAALWMLAAWLRPLLALPDVVVLESPTRRVLSQRVASSRAPWRNLRTHKDRGPPSVLVPIF